MGNKPPFCYVIFLANTVKQEAFLWCRHVERTLKKCETLHKRKMLLVEHTPCSGFHWDPTLIWFSQVMCVITCVSKWPTWSVAANPTQGCQHLQRILPKNEALEQLGYGQWLCGHISGQMVYDQILNLLLASCGNMGHQLNDSAHHFLSL